MKVEVYEDNGFWGFRITKGKTVLADSYGGHSTEEEAKANGEKLKAAFDEHSL